ncbi:MAG: Cof-type HAD-IIB family hydrolase [Acidimicrobiia bacterium]|nr:Cof-type HAD-IIB family hydrolase [Acidimicrobiia bacterium]
MNAPVGSTIRLVASDLDGTLFGPDGTVSSRTAETLRAVAAAGVEIVVATGRSHWSAVPRLEHVGCLRWLICSNGATVYDLEAGGVVVHRPLTGAQVSEVVDGLRDRFPTVGFAWESPEGVFHTDRWVVNRAATDARFEAKPRPTRDLRVGEDTVLKLMIAHDELTEYAWLDAVAADVPVGLSTSTSGAAFVEITAADANKGDALRLLCADVGIDRTETIAFGDHANDLGMLAWVGVGYAMANAGPRVREIADATAPHHADDGVARVLAGLVLG